MATGGVVQTGASAAQAVGRYFSVISVIPCMILVAYVYLLISSGSWNHPPDWSYAIQSLEHLGVGGVAVLVLVGFGLGLAIHPLQFAVVQFFEGYWGVSRPALRMRSERIMRYKRRFREIDERGMKASDVLVHRRTSPKSTRPWAECCSAGSLRNTSDETTLFLANNRPEGDKSVMPTRLGNVLRSFELSAGSQYGLDSLAVVPLLLLIAPDSHVDYVNDQGPA